MPHNILDTRRGYLGYAHLAPNKNANVDMWTIQIQFKFMFEIEN